MLKNTESLKLFLKSLSLKKLSHRIIAIPLLSVFLVSHSFAKSQINSEFSIHLPQDFMRKLVDKKWDSLKNQEFTASWQLPDQTVQAREVPVQIHNIVLDVRTQLQKPEIQPDENILRLSSNNLQVQVRVGNVEIDHVVEREIGGVIGRFRIQAQCRDVILNLNKNEGLFSLDVAPQIDKTTVGTRLVGYDLQWTGGWSTPGFTCTGAKGFEELVQSEVKRVTENWQIFLAPYRQQLQSYIQNYVGKYRVEFNQSMEVPFPGQTGVGLLVQVQELKSLEDGFSLNGAMSLSLKRGSGKADLKLKEEARTVSSDQATLLLPDKIAEVFLNQLFPARSWSRRFESKDIAPLTNLMQKRWQQYFAWPELLDFAKNVNFIFDLYSDKAFKWKGRGFNYQVQGHVNAWMQAPRDGRYMRFMYFVIPFQAQTEIKIAHGKARLKVYDPSISLQAYWDREYIRNYQANKYIMIKKIEEGLKEGVANQTLDFSMDLPRLPIAEGVELALDKVQRTKSGSFQFLLSVH